MTARFTHLDWLVLAFTVFYVLRLLLYAAVDILAIHLDADLQKTPEDLQVRGAGNRTGPGVELALCR
jgi:hypothetical protein